MSHKEVTLITRATSPKWSKPLSLYEQSNTGVKTKIDMGHFFSQKTLVGWQTKPDAADR